jgi:Rrf2 family protein
MNISRRAQYAVSASLDLAAQAANLRGIRSVEIARRTRVPEKFLETILRDLRHAGLVTSKRGPAGGHRLAADPSVVTVMAVVEAIDGPFEAVGASPAVMTSPEETCVRAVWERVAAAVRETLAAVTLDDLRRDAVAPGPTDYTI